MQVSHEALCTENEPGSLSPFLDLKVQNLGCKTGAPVSLLYADSQSSRQQKEHAFLVDRHAEILQ